MLLIGVDYHPSFQTIAFFDEETGECGGQELNHSDGQAERFYRGLQQRGIRVRVGMEATGYSRWFERLLAELGIEIWMGDPAEIKAKRVKKRRRPTAMMLCFYLDYCGKITFLKSGYRVRRIRICGVTVRGTGIGWLQMRTRIMNQLQALAMNEGYRWKKRSCSTNRDRHQLEKLALAPWRESAPARVAGVAGSHESDDSRADGRGRAGEARKRPEVLRLMTHPGVGPLTALAYVLIIGTPGAVSARQADRHVRGNDSV